MSIFPYLEAFIMFAAFLASCAALFDINAPRDRIIRTVLCTAAFITVLHIPLVCLVTLEQIRILMPLTTGIPIILCMHLLSSGGFFQTCAIWTTGCLVGIILHFLRSFLVLLQPRSPFNPLQNSVISTLLLLLAATALVCMVWFSLRPPFHRWGQEVEESWTVILAPTLLAFLLLSYISSNAAKPAVLLFTLLSSLSVFLSLSRILVLSAELREARRTERMARQQLELQSRDYRGIQQKMELSRTYRHDMRHHLAALDAMLSQNEDASARDYIHGLQGTLAETVTENWCASAAINAMLSAYISRARENSCQVTADIRLRKELPFDEIELCVILANALENAAQACQELPEERRKISLTAELTGNLRFVLTVENTCAREVSFGPNGLPAVSHRPGHGLGMQSISAVVDKYGGLLRCQCRDGKFILRAVLFPPIPRQQVQEEVRQRKAVIRPQGMAMLGLILVCAFLNSSTALTSALEALPVIGPVVRVMDLRTYTASLENEGAQLSVVEPVVEGGNLSPELSAGVEAVNRSREQFIASMLERFLTYVSEKSGGYVGMDVSYEVLRDDEKLLALRLFATVNMGGSAEYHRYLTLDRASGELLALGELFLPDSGYVDVLSQEVRRQMERQQLSGEGDYFLPGGIWPEEECFQAIAPDQEFYIDAAGQLVLVFEQFDVAPGSMGCPEFTIPAGVTADITARSGLLTPAAQE